MHVEPQWHLLNTSMTSAQHHLKLQKLKIVQNNKIFYFNPVTSFRWLARQTDFKQKPQLEIFANNNKKAGKDKKNNNNSIIDLQSLGPFLL